MQRRICFVLFFLISGELLFPQSLKKNISFQIDKISTTITGKKQFIITCNLGSQIFILRRTKQSLSVIGYTATTNDKVYNVYSISANDDSSLIKAIDSLYGDITQHHNYRNYSRKVFDSANFFLTFDRSNRLQVFHNNMASHYQIREIDFIDNSLNAYLVMPYNQLNRRIKDLQIDNWGELLKYLNHLE